MCPQVETFSNVVELQNHIHRHSTNKQGFLVLGEGSNTIFTEDFTLPILRNKITGIKVTQTSDAYRVRVGGGENWHKLVSFCVNNDIGGLENLALIPGTVGAAPIQNIGAYGVEVETLIHSVEFYDTRTQTLSSFNREQCRFGYRDSIFKQQPEHQRIITHVEFALPKSYSLEHSYGPLQSLTEPSLRAIFDAVIAIRRQKLPNPDELGNAGSFFKNPSISKAHFETLKQNYSNIPGYDVDGGKVKVPAAWLIDYLGFKGKQLGNIACHVNQPLVLVNMGGGTGQDLLALARSIKQAVKDEFDISLENEVRLMGRDGALTL